MAAVRSQHQSCIEEAVLRVAGCLADKYTSLWACRHSSDLLSSAKYYKLGLQKNRVTSRQRLEAVWSLNTSEREQGVILQSCWVSVDPGVRGGRGGSWQRVQLAARVVSPGRGSSFIS